MGILAWLPISAGVVFAFASSETAQLLRALGSLLDDLTRAVQNHFATIEQHGVVLPMSRQPVRRSIFWTCAWCPMVCMSCVGDTTQ